METNFTELLRIEDEQTFRMVRQYMETIIREVTEQGALEDTSEENTYTKEIGRIAMLLNGYEKNVLNLFSKRTKNPLIQAIEDYLYSANLKQKDAADILELTPPVFSNILNGKKRITMDIAQRLRKKLGIDANLLIEFA